MSGLFVQSDYSEVRVGLPRGVKWCKSEGIVFPDGVKGGKSWAANGG